MGADSIPLGGVSPPPPLPLTHPLKKDRRDQPHVPLQKRVGFPCCLVQNTSTSEMIADIACPWRANTLRVRTFSCFPRKDTPFSVVLAPDGRCHPLEQGSQGEPRIFLVTDSTRFQGQNSGHPFGNSGLGLVFVPELFRWAVSAWL